MQRIGIPELGRVLFLGARQGLRYRHHRRKRRRDVGWDGLRQESEGIMQILWTCVVEYARTKGCQSVGCMVFPDNQEMRAVGERFGKLRSLVYEFKV